MSKITQMVRDIDGLAMAVAEGRGSAASALAEKISGYGPDAVPQLMLILKNIRVRGGAKPADAELFRLASRAIVDIGEPALAVMQDMGREFEPLFKEDADEIAVKISNRKEVDVRVRKLWVATHVRDSQFTVCDRRALVAYGAEAVAPLLRMLGKVLENSGKPELETSAFNFTMKAKGMLEEIGPAAVPDIRDAMHNPHLGKCLAGVITRIEAACEPPAKMRMRLTNEVRKGIAKGEIPPGCLFKC
ncbi:Uncharacterised protein [uncultured archaeon]|nr:Uncharacterised protein [uncultured archaeon]